MRKPSSWYFFKAPPALPLALFLSVSSLFEASPASITFGNVLPWLRLIALGGFHNVQCSLAIPSATKYFSNFDATPQSRFAPSSVVQLPMSTTLPKGKPPPQQVIHVTQTKADQGLAVQARARASRFRGGRRWGL
jgi:hypothetical protein